VSTQRRPDPMILLGLEIDPDREPIEGVVRDERGAEQRFTGWLALMERLEAVRAGRGGR
jgi:hypothetical protein